VAVSNYYNGDYKAMIALLIKAGADLTAKKDDRTPKEYAQGMYSDELVACFP
jgi:hypothetical protein